MALVEALGPAERSKRSPECWAASRITETARKHAREMLNQSLED